MLRMTRGVEPTCLERALVLQRWYLAQGRRKAVLVGVTAPSSGFKAHAWLEGEQASAGEFTELLRFEAG